MSGLVGLEYSQAAVDDIIAKFPAQNFEQEKALAQKIIDQNAGGIVAVCGKLQPAGTGNDAKVRQTVNAMTFCVGTPGTSESQRKIYVEALIQSLDSHKDKEVKAFLISQIQLIGKVEAIKPLGKYLSDQRLGEPASRALVRIGTEDAARELYRSLDSAKDKSLIAVIRSLGALKYKPAAKDIAAYLKVKDRDLRLATFWALANIAKPSMAKKLAAAKAKAAKAKGDAYEKAMANSYYLHFVKRLAEDGNRRKSIKICRKLFKKSSGSGQTHVRCSALSTLVEIAGEKATDDIFVAMGDADLAVQARAMELALNVPGKSATRKMVVKLKRASSKVKLNLLSMLAKRKDRSALPGIVAAMKDNDEAVRFAAIDAAVILGQDEAIDDFLAILNKTEKRNDIKKIKQALLRIKGEKVMEEIAGSLPGMKSGAKVVLIEILTQRRADEYMDVILAQIDSDVAKVRSAAFKALSAIGGGKALKAVVTLMKNSDADVRDAAVRTLCNWRNEEAVDEILKVQSQSEKFAYQVLAVRGSVRLITQAQWTTQKKVSKLRQVMDNVKRVDEKRIVIGGLATVRDLDALIFATTLLGDKQLNQETALAIAKIACPQNEQDKGLVGGIVSLVLERAAKRIADADIRKKIEEHVKNISGADDANLALGKPVSISCRAQGSHKPEFVVDGDASAKAGSYWGDKWPSWLQIDLEKIAKIDMVHIYFFFQWNDKRYYQYDIELSSDGKKWTKVVDRSKNTTAVSAAGEVHRFQPTNARYVRVNIHKNSVNEAVHIVECKVYADGIGRVDKQKSSAAAVMPKTPEGFVSLFNGKDLAGWKGLLKGPYDNPIKRMALPQGELVKLQKEADEHMRKHWFVENGILVFDGHGSSLATTRMYADFEMYVDWKLLTPNGDSGLYLRGSPQVQIWDPAHWKIGSGGLYNNKKNPSKPTSIADNPIGVWNTFYIKMVGEKVTVKLNDVLIVDNVTLENYWDRNRAIFPLEQIELQCHGHPLCFRNIFIREIPRTNEFTNMFNGKNLIGWIGDTKGYVAEDGVIVCKPGGKLYLEKQYSDFHFKFDFKLTPNANNGLGIRAAYGKDAAYHGMELQILDNTGSSYTKLKPWQYHGSIYGIVPAKRGFLKPVGQWNHEEVIAKGHKIKIILNGTVIVDADIKQAAQDYKPGQMHNPKGHPGLFNKKGYIGFMGHGSVVYFRNLEIKELQ